MDIRRSKRWIEHKMGGGEDDDRQTEQETEEIKKWPRPDNKSSVWTTETFPEFIMFTCRMGLPIPIHGNGMRT